MKKLILVAALFATGATVSFAQNAPTQAAKTEKPAAKKSTKSKKAGAQAAMYECPMKCEPATTKAGKCGKCGMDLVEVKKKAK